jgi:16S rRNA (cytidine1402-2'-O)-methyltransferase
MFEEVRRGPLSQLAAETDVPKGEIVVLVAPPEAQAAPDDDVVDALLRKLMAEHSLKVAAALAAEELKLPRRDVYTRALALREEE